MIKNNKEGTTSTKPDAELQNTMQNKAKSEQIEENLSFVNGRRAFQKQLHHPEPPKFPSLVSSPVFPPSSSLNSAVGTMRFSIKLKNSASDVFGSKIQF